MKKVLLSVCLGLLIVPNAHAVPSCGSSLMPAFTANQATQLCKMFGSAVSQSLIPNADNSYDLGSASFTWRTLYTGTSRIAKTSDILRVEQDAQRLFTWDASSDVLFTQTWGDGGTTAVQKFTINASTADADDDSTLRLAGGGAAATDGSRGGQIDIAGEEVSGGGDITYNAGASDTHIFQIAGTTEAILGTTDFTPGAVAGNALGTLAVPWLQVLTGGVAIDADVTSIVGVNVGIVTAKNGSSDADDTALIGYGANAIGASLKSFKTRATTTDANTVVQSGDSLFSIGVYGADGAAYRSAARIDFSVDGTPGSADMPGSIDFLVSPDGSAAPASALKISNTKNIVFGGTLIGTGTATLGWTVIASGAGVACETACTTPCVFGQNATFGLELCNVAVTGLCVCAGAT